MRDPLLADLSPEGNCYHQQYLYKHLGGYCGIGGCQSPENVETVLCHSGPQQGR